jgi:hypothetical protein
VAVSWGPKGGPEFRSRRLLARLRETHLEAPLGQGVEGCAAQPTVKEEGDHRSPPVAEGSLGLPQRREGGAQDHQLIDQMADLQALVIIFRPVRLDQAALATNLNGMILFRTQARVAPLRTTALNAVRA